MLIEALAPLRLRLPERDLALRPGEPVELPDNQARRLMEKAGGKVRQVVRDAYGPLEMQAASPTARPIYWESTDGTWHGPVKPEYLGRSGLGDSERFWVTVTYQDSILWICADLLRSRQAFEAQGTTLK